MSQTLKRRERTNVLPGRTILQCEIPIARSGYGPHRDDEAQPYLPELETQVGAHGCDILLGVSIAIPDVPGRNNTMTRSSRLTGSTTVTPCPTGLVLRRPIPVRTKELVTELEIGSTCSPYGLTPRNISSHASGRVERLRSQTACHLALRWPVLLSSSRSTTCWNEVTVLSRIRPTRDIVWVCINAAIYFRFFPLL